MTVKLSKPDYQAIPQFTRTPSDGVDVGWAYLEQHVEEHVNEYGLEVNPDFQRGHVWDPDKQIAFVEFILRGGTGANILYLNAPGWSRGDLGSYVLVDGLQRLTAALAFLRSEIPAFGYLRSEYTGTMRLHSPRFRWIINNLKTRADVLQWYLEMNTGGVVHTNSELDRVRALLEEESKP